jgi:hypothetical protein
MNCRHCAAPLRYTFLDLGSAPLSNAYLTVEDLSRPETYYPLKIKVCDQCWLVQTEDYAKADDMFTSDYAYFSSTSSGWLAHAREFSREIIEELGLGVHSHVIEIACNDGYLLRNFVAAGIPCTGIEPTASTAALAEKLGIPVLRQFFGETLGKQLAASGKQADLIVGNNVYAHVPDINDFTCGLQKALKAGGTISLEFPHLMRLIEHTQFDTAYHEHFSYFSLHAVTDIFSSASLRIWKVEELATHGGSLRVYGCHSDDSRKTEASVTRILREEIRRGLFDLKTYLNFQPRAEKIKNELLMFLITKKHAKEKIAAYGAAAKGNTLLNYAGIKADLLDFVCDAATAKQGKFMPGSHIPICPPDLLRTFKPDYVVILPWNICSEVEYEHAYIKDWGGKFIRFVPNMEVLGS